MSVNLVSLLAQYITPELIGRVSASLGVDRTLLGKAATYAAPLLLRALAGLASTPLGAQRLAGAVEKQDPGILGTLESAIGGEGQDSLIKGGVGTLESLLGGSAVSALGGALSKFTGIGEGAVSSLLGLATPAVLGTLSKEQAAHGLDASGLARLLESQKENISAAIPAELGDLLGQSGIPGFAPGAHAAQAERPAVSRPALSVTRPAPAEAAQSFNWRLPLAAVAALALASWFFFGNRPAQVTENTKTVAPALSVEGIDLKSSVEKTLGGVKTALLGIRDRASAEEAVPQLQKSVTEISGLRDLAGKLPVDARASFAVLVSQLRPSIEDLFNKVLEIPGVAPIARPVIDSLRAKLDTLSKTEVKA